MSLLRPLPLLSSALLCGALVGCGLLGRSEATSAASAHAVFLTVPGCPTFVAKTAGAGFAVATAEGGYTPVAGDLLAGGLRAGEVSLLLFRSGSDDAEGDVHVRVRTYDRDLDAVQAFWRRHCDVPPPVDPVETRIEPRPGRPEPPDSLSGVVPVLVPGIVPGIVPGVFPGIVPGVEPMVEPDSLR